MHETSKHLFFECLVFGKSWSNVLSYLEINYVLLRNQLCVAKQQLLACGSIHKFCFQGYNNNIMPLFNISTFLIKNLSININPFSNY